MARCSYCSGEELLPFNCNYCDKKFCRAHHLPEKHECAGLTKERIKSRRQWSVDRRKSTHAQALEIPGVVEVIERAWEKKKFGATGFDVNEKTIVILILLLIIVLGLVSRIII
jgi:hypothetical protein